MTTYVGIAIIVVSAATLAALFEVARRSVDAARRDDRLREGWTVDKARRNRDPD